MNKKLFFYLDAAQEYRWTLVSRNGKIIGASSESFTTLGNAKKNARLTVGYRWRPDISVDYSLDSAGAGW